MALIPNLQAGAQPVNIDSNWIRIDYLEHFFVFFVLTILFLVGYFNPAGKNKLSRFLPLSGIILYGLLSELVQLAVPGRAFNMVDFYYNLGGITGGVVLYFVFARLNRKKKLTEPIGHVR
jgi:VanZ family protein